MTKRNFDIKKEKGKNKKLMALLNTAPSGFIYYFFFL
jgi:hypothetical protein